MNDCPVCHGSPGHIACVGEKCPGRRLPNAANDEGREIIEQQIADALIEDLWGSDPHTPDNDE